LSLLVLAPFPNACTKGLLLSLEIQKDGSDSEDFLFGEFRIDRERETLLTQPFSDREMARSVTEMRVGLLQVNRHRVMDGSLDAGLVQARAHPVAFWSFDNITMPHGLRIRKVRRQLVRGIGKQFGVVGSEISTSCI